MEYELIDVGPCRKKLSLKFDVSDVDAAFEESFREINDYVKIKGFRKGKAPLRTLQHRFAKEAASGAKQQLTDRHIREVVEKEKLRVLGGITSKDANELPTAGTPFSVEAEFDVSPDFELPEYKQMELSEQSTEVAEEKIDEALERYRRMFANYEAVDEPARIGDVLTVDFKTTVGDEEIMAMDGQRLRVEGDILFGLPCPNLTDKFTGAKKDDAVAVAVTLPEDHPNPELRGREALVTVTVKGVERGELPEIDDAFAAGIGMGSLDEFRNRVKGNLMREAFIEAKQREEDEIINRLLAEAEFPVPLGMVESETQALVEQHRMRMVRTGVKQDGAMATQLEKYRPEASKEAERKVRWTILSEKIAEKEGIQVTNEDLNAQVEALAQNYNTTPAKIVQRIREFDGVGPMMAEILSIKVIQLISRLAKGGAGTAGETEAANADAAKIATEPEKCDCGDDHGHAHDHDHGCDCGHDH